MKHTANFEFADAAFAGFNDGSAVNGLPKAWWLLPFVGLGAFLWVQIISSLISFF